MRDVVRGIEPGAPAAVDIGVFPGSAAWAGDLVSLIFCMVLRKRRTCHCISSTPRRSSPMARVPSWS